MTEVSTSFSSAFTFCVPWGKWQYHFVTWMLVGEVIRSGQIVWEGLEIFMIFWLHISSCQFVMLWWLLKGAMLFPLPATPPPCFKQQFPWGTPSLEIWGACGCVCCTWSFMSNTSEPLHVCSKTLSYKPMWPIPTNVFYTTVQCTFGGTNAWCVLGIGNNTSEDQTGKCSGLPGDLKVENKQKKKHRIYMHLYIIILHIKYIIRRW